MISKKKIEENTGTISVLAGTFASGEGLSSQISIRLNFPPKLNWAERLE